MTNKPSHDEPKRSARKLGTGNIDQSAQYEELYSLFNLSLDMLCVADLDGYFRMFNSAFETTLGHSKQDLLDTPFIEFVHPDDVSSTLEAMELLSTGESVAYFENRYRCKDGSYKWLAWTSVPNLEKGTLYATARDITKRKKSEDRLRKSEARLRALFDSADEFIFVVNAEGDIINANRKVYENSGYKKGDVIGSNIKKFSCDCSFTELRRRGSSRADVEFVCKDGRVLQLDCSATAIVDDNGDFSTFLIIQRDITDRKQIEKDLAISEKRFRTIFNSSNQLIGVLDHEGILLDANQTALDVVGLKKEDVVGRPFWDIYCWSYSADIQRRAKAAIREAAQGDLVHFVEDLQVKGNEIRTIDNTFRPVANEQGETEFIIPEGWDITEIKKAEEEKQQLLLEIAHVVRLSTAGEMASGIAHEINQPLTALMSYCGTAASLVNSLASPPKILCEILEQATAQARRASDIIKNLRYFVSEDDSHTILLDVDQAIRDIMLFIEVEAHEGNVVVEFYPGSQNSKLKANKIQIQQVLINMVRNSIEAIRNAEISKGHVVIQTHLLPNSSIEVTVTDNGPGIDADIADMIFHPFQTSKDTGMGIGLSLSRRIIENHGGRLWMDKDYHNGALFRFQLPISS